MKDQYVKNLYDSDSHISEISTHKIHIVRHLQHRTVIIVEHLA
jgi:hypothetical protein